MKFLVFVCLVLAVASGTGCRASHRDGKSAKLQVTATIFPLYDFARSVGGDHAEVTLLLPPGVEPHHFEPNPEEIFRINRADIFMYTTPAMEPWAVPIAKGTDNKKLRVVEAGQGIPLLPTGGREADDHGHGSADPHIWLDFAQAATMVTNIEQAFSAADPVHAANFHANAERYRSRLSELDREYRQILSGCSSKMLLHGGHYAFGYLARRYGLTYISAFPAGGDSEPSARQMIDLVNLMKENHLRYVFYEELASPRTADTLARETGAQLLLLNGAHTISRNELAQGTDFFAIMERNLKNLQEGLGCK